MTAEEKVALAEEKAALAEKRTSMAAGLRELADLIERPTSALPDAVRVTIDANVWDYHEEPNEQGSTFYVDNEKTLVHLRKLARGLGRGKKEKAYGLGGFWVKRLFGEHVSLTVLASRDVVCKKVPTGRIIRHPSRTVPAYDEVEYEWDCADGEAPILGGSSTKRSQKSKAK